MSSIALPIPSAFEIIRMQLKKLGYFQIDKKKENHNSIDLIADGSMRSIFVQAKVSAEQKPDKVFTKSEIEKIIGEAKSLGKEPWTAIIRIGADGQLIEGIIWTNLASLKRKTA